MKKSLIVMMSVILLLSVISVSAANYCVDGSSGNDLNSCVCGTSNCATIQGAIAKTSSGDTVKVLTGTYSESVVMNQTSITLESDGGPSSATINGSVTIQNDSCTLGGTDNKGFTIENSTKLTSGVDGGVNLINLASGANNVKISENILNTSEDPHFAISITTFSVENLTIFNNSFILGNTTDEAIVSDELMNITGLNITKNRFSVETVAAYAAAISITVPDVSTIPSYIRENEISNAGQGIALGNNTNNYGLVSGSSYFEINNNTFYTNTIAVDIISADGPTNASFQNISILDNNFSVSGTAIAINASSYSIANGAALLAPSNFTISMNGFEAGTGIAINCMNSTTVVKAENNWWNAVSGPGGFLIGETGKGGAGAGDNVTTNVDFSPWCEINKTCLVTSNIKVQNGTLGIYNFTSIQDAIGNASAGDTIEVGAGLYSEANITVDEQVALIGVGVTVEMEPANGNNVFNITADNVEIEGFNMTIGNTGIQYSAATDTEQRYVIQVHGDNVLIENNTIRTTGNWSIPILVGDGNYSNITLYAADNDDAISNLTIIDNVITVNDIAPGILFTPTNTSDVHNASYIARNTITANVGYPIILNDVNNSQVTYNNLTVSNSTGNSTGLTNFAWRSVYQNISNLSLTLNIVNVSSDDPVASVILFGNLSSNTLNYINITNNTIKNWGNGIGIHFAEGGVINTSLQVEHNAFYNDLYNLYNIGYAIQNNGTTTIDATPNYWGNTTGPGGNGTNGGGRTIGLVMYDPWYTTTALTTLSTAAAASSSSSSSTGGSSTVNVDWVNTYTVPEEDFESEDGYTKELAAKGRMKVKIDGETHYVGVKEVTTSTVSLEINSDTVITATLQVGDERKFDMSQDGWYDLSVLLNSVKSNKAVITIKSINEQVTVALEKEQEQKQEKAEEQREEDIEEQATYWWWIVGIIVILIILIIVYGVKGKKKKKKK